jgi:hypothetical protein
LASKVLPKYCGEVNNLKAFQIVQRQASGNGCFPFSQFF